ncbi:MAG TPA: hypothetical protein VH120_14195 [Gemmataceae bacterium]|jgi:hypothetical protein|nr:hypothetical protein [Gemmataceae bacterium]
MCRNRFVSPAAASRARAFVLAAVALATAAATPGLAHAIGPIVTIEQDWTIVLNTPDSTSGFPQIAIPIRGDVTNQDHGALLLINLSDYPSYIQGGLQTQLWDSTGTVCLAHSTSTATGCLSNSGETIRFTVFYVTSGTGIVSMGIKSGRSLDWGDWTKAGLTIVGAETIASFPNVNAQDTADTTEILSGSDRIKSMTINAWRTYDAMGKSVSYPIITVY